MTNLAINLNMEQLDKTLQTYFLDKAPKLPADIQKLIVQYGPFLVLIGVVFSVVGIVASFGFMSIGNPMRMFAGAYVGFMYQVYLLFSIVAAVLSALALPGLFNKRVMGWKYMWYNTILGVVANAITLNLAGLIIGGGLGFYILYQIKNHYK